MRGILVLLIKHSIRLLECSLDAPHLSGEGDREGEPCSKTGLVRLLSIDAEGPAAKFPRVADPSQPVLAVSLGMEHKAAHVSIVAGHRVLEASPAAPIAIGPVFAF